MSNSEERVSVHIADGQGELEIVDSHFLTVARGFGQVQCQLPPGLYKARARAGDVTREALFSVDPGGGANEVKFDALRFASPLPLDGTSTTHEYHQDAVWSAIRNGERDLGLGHDSALLVLVRDPSDACRRQLGASAVEQARYLRSFAGFRLDGRDGTTLFEGDEIFQITPDLGFAVFNVALAPGEYVLVHQSDAGEAVAMPLPALAGWQTQVYISLAFPQGLAAPGVAALADRALMLAPLGQDFHPSDRQFRLAEIARQALTQGRQALSEAQLTELLHEKFVNPMLGLIAAYVLLLRGAASRNLLRVVVRNLGALLGPEFPDLMALRLALAAQEGRPPELPPAGIIFPPLLRASWEILVQQPALMPEGGLARRVASRLVAQGPWLAWKPMESAVPNAAQVFTPEERLLRAIFGETTDSSLASRRSAHADGEEFFDLADELGDDREPRGAPEPRRRRGDAAKKPRPAARPRNQAGAARAKLLHLAQDFPWQSWLKDPQNRSAKAAMLERLSSLQRGLLPTLQLVGRQIAEGDEFTLEELLQLQEGMGVPLPAFSESLDDFVQLAEAAGVNAPIFRSAER